MAEIKTSLKAQYQCAERGCRRAQSRLLRDIAIFSQQLAQSALLILDISEERRVARDLKPETYSRLLGKCDRESVSASKNGNPLRMFCGMRFSQLAAPVWRNLYFHIGQPV